MKTTTNDGNLFGMYCLLALAGWRVVLLMLLASMGGCAVKPPLSAPSASVDVFLDRCDAAASELATVRAEAEKRFIAKSLTDDNLAMVVAAIQEATAAKVEMEGHIRRHSQSEAEYWADRVLSAVKFARAEMAKAGGDGIKS